MHLNKYKYVCGPYVILGKTHYIGQLYKSIKSETATEETNFILFKIQYEKLEGNQLKLRMYANIKSS